MRKSRKFRRTFKKNLKNKKSHRMRGGGGCISKERVHCEASPVHYGIVVGPGDRFYVKSFTLWPYRAPNFPFLRFYKSDDIPPMSLQVTTDPTKMGQGAATAIPRPIALIDYLKSGSRLEDEDVFERPTVLSENRYLYSSREDAEMALHELMRPAATRCAALPSTVTPTVSDRAKAYLQQDTLPAGQRLDAIAHAGLSQSLIQGLVRGMPTPRKGDAQRATQSMRRLSPSKYPSEDPDAVILHGILGR